MFFGILVRIVSLSGPCFFHPLCHSPVKLPKREKRKLALCFTNPDNPCSAQGQQQDLFTSVAAGKKPTYTIDLLIVHTQKCGDFFAIIFRRNDMSSSAVSKRSSSSKKLLICFILILFAISPWNVRKLFSHVFFFGRSYSSPTFMNRLILGYNLGVYLGGIAVT